MLLSANFLRLFHSGHKKLVSRYLGPFEVLARKGAVAYELRNACINGQNVQCDSCVTTEAVQDGCGASAPPPAVLDDGEVECEN